MARAPRIITVGVCLFAGYVALSSYWQVSAHGYYGFRVPLVVLERALHLGCNVKVYLYDFWVGSKQSPGAGDWYFPIGSIEEFSCREAETQRKYAALLAALGEAPLPESAGEGVDILRAIVETYREPTYVVRAERLGDSGSLTVKTGYPSGRSGPPQFMQEVTVALGQDDWAELRTLLSEESLPIQQYVMKESASFDPSYRAILSESFVSGRHRAYRRRYDYYPRRDGEILTFLDRVVGCGFQTDGVWSCWHLPSFDLPEADRGT